MQNPNESNVLAMVVLGDSFSLTLTHNKTASFSPKCHLTIAFNCDCMPYGVVAILTKKFKKISRPYSTGSLRED